MFQGITGPSSVLNDMTWKVTLVFITRLFVEKIIYSYTITLSAIDMLG